MMQQYFISLYIFGTLLLLMLVAAILWLAVKHWQRGRHYQAAIRELECRHDNELLKTTTEVQEQALNWISREIHDDINQSLSIIGIELQHAAENKTSEEKTAVIRESVGEIGHCILRLRNLCHMSSGAMIKEMGLVQSVEKELQHLRSVCKQHCEFEHPGNLPPFSDNATLLLFRITQEALYNVTRHARAASAVVTLATRKDKLILQISDDGKGMPPGAWDKGLGLMNMKQRAILLEGVLDIDTAPGKGTKLTIAVPLSAATASSAGEQAEKRKNRKIKPESWIKRSLRWLSPTTTSS